ncbi:hypothetical protein ABZS29_01855 [Kribbella sp. NPDC005582]|uniref:hypothetical protein n=1 Tax=Kribbella sp. NPDC005582 TaxID=3156893 RepID=UPI0033A31378
MEWWWQRQLADEGLEVVIHQQELAVSRAQLFAAGWSESRIRRPLRARRWRVLHPGVYATHTGPIGYDGRLLAALLYAGPEAAWSHDTAAEQLGLIKPDANRPVYVTIPERRRIAPRPQLVIYRDSRWADRLAAVVPPRRTAPHAVLDVVAGSRTLDDAAAIVAEACQSARPCGPRRRCATAGSTSRLGRAQSPYRFCRPSATAGRLLSPAPADRRVPSDEVDGVLLPLRGSNPPWIERLQVDGAVLVEAK